MTSRLITEPASPLVVTLAELKAHVKLDSDYTDEDGDLTLKLYAAQSAIEEATGRRRLLEATWEMRLKDWPRGDCIELDVPQVSSIEWLKYRGTDGVLQTVSTDVYRLEGGYDVDSSPTQHVGCGRVELKYGQSWPTATLDEGEAVMVRYVAGWDEAASVPYPLKAAVLLEAGHLYRNRESVTVGNTAVESKALVRGVESLIAPYTVYRF